MNESFSIRHLLQILGAIIFALVLSYIPLAFPIEWHIENSVAITVFLVFLLVFLMNNVVDQQKELRRNINLELSRIRRVHHLAENMSSKKTKWTTDLDKAIEAYLDFFKKHSFADYQKERGPFRAISHAIYSFKPKSAREQIIYRELLVTTRELAATRQNIASLLKQRISTYRWAVLVATEGLVIFSLLISQDINIAGFLANSALIATIFIVTVFIWEVDNYSESELEQFAQLYVKNKESLHREHKK